MKHGLNTDSGLEVGEFILLIRVYSVFNLWLVESNDND